MIILDYRTRKTIRLKGYDYSRNGAYFLTLCVKDKHEMLGRVIVGAGLTRLQTNTTRSYIELSEIGIIVKRNIEILPGKYPSVKIDKYIIMPNHVHLIIAIQNDDYCKQVVVGFKNGREIYGNVQGNHMEGRVDPAPTIGQIIGYLKYQTTKEIGIRGFWQRSFHDHIIRNEEEYRQIWHYIDENPQNWETDEYFVKK